MPDPSPFLDRDITQTVAIAVFLAGLLLALSIGRKHEKDN